MKRNALGLTLWMLTSDTATNLHSTRVREPNFQIFRFTRSSWNSFGCGASPRTERCKLCKPFKRAAWDTVSLKESPCSAPFLPPIWWPKSVSRMQSSSRADVLQPISHPDTSERISPLPNRKCPPLHSKYINNNIKVTVHMQLKTAHML